MPTFSLFFFVAGATLLSLGFIKKNHALLVLSAFLWLATGTWDDAAQGFHDGWNKNSDATEKSRGA